MSGFSSRVRAAGHGGDSCLQAFQVGSLVRFMLSLLHLRSTRTCQDQDSGALCNTVSSQRFVVILQVPASDYQLQRSVLLVSCT